ncbi:type 1 fimbrial protein [Burkholderia arboris]|uniref:fimbrial protein n=1 Tax=Burkholderia arboris TaxID=488730 RepID=UPI001CF3369B|nr:fimbrial protein [Burkholderia arboris]MCA8037555.1 type 1 fimbrial protein [Burkholderia arboris]
MKIKKSTHALSMILAATGLAAASAAHASDGTIQFTGSVIASTCKVSNGTGGDIPVALPKIGTNTLATAGKTAGRTPFTLVLEGCTSGGANPTKVGVVFESGSNVNQSTGRLTLDTDEGAASNVEISVLNDKQSPIRIGAMGDQGGQLVAIAADGKATLNYFAEYYATAAATAGQANSKVQYSLTYQ